MTLAEDRIAVVGAGMAGAACAHALAQAGGHVQLYDKGRSVGGRLAQRRVPAGAFDHGAQYMTAKDEVFIAAIHQWHENGIIESWDVFRDDKTRWIGTPAMNRPVKALLGDLSVSTTTRIVKLLKNDGCWQLESEEGHRHGPFAQAVLAMPAPQARDLLDNHPFVDLLRKVEFAPCWAGMVAFEQPVLTDAVHRLDQGIIAWAANNASKPGRIGQNCWTVHASPEWSLENLETSPYDIGPALLDAFAKAVDQDLPEPGFLEVHRWRYAMVTEPLGEPCLWDGTIGLGLAGDWCLGPRVEAAFVSGQALAAKMLV